MGEAGVLSWGPVPPGTGLPGGVPKDVSPTNQAPAAIPATGPPVPARGRSASSRAQPAGGGPALRVPGHGPPPLLAAHRPLRRSERRLGRRTHLSSARRGGSQYAGADGGSTLGRYREGGGAAHAQAALGLRLRPQERWRPARCGCALASRFAPEAALAHPVADQREDQLRLGSEFHAVSIYWCFRLMQHPAYKKGELV